VGTLQESPTLLILRCRARHFWERGTSSERASLQWSSYRASGRRWEPGFFLSVRRAGGFFLLFASLLCPRGFASLIWGGYTEGDK
jgi:hypothetical protein